MCRSCGGVISFLIMFFVYQLALSAQRSFLSDNFIPIEKIVIQSRFHAEKITKDNIAQLLNRCVPEISPEMPTIKRKLQGFPSARIIRFGNVDWPHMFVLHNVTAVCLEKSVNRFPIFAAEEFDDTVNPDGVPPSVTDEWYKRIALLIAQKGKAKIVYAFDTGNAYIATYWVSSDLDFVLKYSCEFKKAGEWENGRYDNVFSSHLMTSISDTKRSGLSQKKFPLANRFLQQLH